MEETATSILQGSDTLSNSSAELRNFGMSMAKKSAASVAASSKQHKEDEITRLRVLSHDLSNALEAILQASYLLSQARLDESSHRWAQLIESSSEQAAKINREIRKLLRAMHEE